MQRRVFIEMLFYSIGTRHLSNEVVRLLPNNQSANLSGAVSQKHNLFAWLGKTKKVEMSYKPPEIL